MNIFVLDTDPARAAALHCDRHVPKMVLETAQLLCTVVHYWTGFDTPYKPTHVNHPCALWARLNDSNFAWLAELGELLVAEHQLRFKPKAVHKSAVVITWCRQIMHLNRHIPTGPITPFVQCMPDEYKVPDNAVLAYRRYYAGAKKHMAQWRWPRHEPEWMRPAMPPIA